MASTVHDVDLCARCQRLDVMRIVKDYSTAEKSFGEYIVTDLGNVDEMQKSLCTLCQFFASMALGSQTDGTCDCFLDANLHTFPFFKTRNFQLWAATVGHTYLGQEVDTRRRQNVSGLEDQVVLGIAPEMHSNKESRTTAYHCWYRIGMVAASMGSLDRRGNRWRLETRQLAPDQISYDLLRSWLSTCVDTHDDECAVSPSTEAACVKVIDCETREIVKTPPNCEYLALSYVWGKTQAISPGPMRVQRENLIVLNMPESLPLTVSDAMEVVRRLGFRYLWVDKYCIDQDDPEEKMSQILSMDQIYAHCAVVIIAAVGDDSSFGLPGVTTRLRIPQPIVEAKGLTLCSTLPNPVYTTRRSPWITRGWTYQEAVFPKRRLYFTEHQVVFECNTTHFSEVFQHPPHVKVHQHQHRDSIFVSTDVGEYDDPVIQRYAISSHIKAFSSRNLTYEEDALNAIQGVFQQMQRFEQPIMQFYGLPILKSCVFRLDPLRRDGEVEFSNDPSNLGVNGVLASALYWYHEPVSTEGMRAIKRRRFFPSWTWLGWTGQVSWSSNPPFDERNDIEIAAEDKEGKLWPWSTWDCSIKILRSQESLSGRLRVRGWIIQAKIDNILFGTRRKLFVQNLEIYVSFGRGSIPTSSGNKKSKGVGDLYLALLDKTVSWDLLSLGPSEPLILLKDEGDNQYSRVGATQKTRAMARDAIGLNQRRTELWLI